MGIEIAKKSRKLIRIIIMASFTKYLLYVPKTYSLNPLRPTPQEKCVFFQHIFFKNSVYYCGYVHMAIPLNSIKGGITWVTLWQQKSWKVAKQIRKPEEPYKWVTLTVRKNLKFLKAHFFCARNAYINVLWYVCTYSWHTEGWIKELKYCIIHFKHVKSFFNTIVKLL